jgi:hypothetical protein
MIYYIDIDNTICHTIDSNYWRAKPLKDRITKINNLFHAGHTIIYWSARGSHSGKDWYDFTDQQLNDWGCLRHKLVLQKPAYDIFIDDKVINTKDFFE